MADTASFNFSRLVSTNSSAAMMCASALPTSAKAAAGMKAAFPASGWDALCATIVGNRGKPSGKSSIGAKGLAGRHGF